MHAWSASPTKIRCEDKTFARAVPNSGRGGAKMRECRFKFAHKRPNARLNVASTTARMSSAWIYARHGYKYPVWLSELHRKCSLSRERARARAHGNWVPRVPRAPQRGSSRIASAKWVATPETSSRWSCSTRRAHNVNIPKGSQTRVAPVFAVTSSLHVPPWLMYVLVCTRLPRRNCERRCASRCD